MKTILTYLYIFAIWFLYFCASYSVTYGICVEDGKLMLIGAFLFGLGYFLSKLMLIVFDKEITKLKKQIKELANKYGKEEY